VPLAKPQNLQHQSSHPRHSCAEVGRDMVRDGSRHRGQGARFLADSQAGRNFSFSWLMPLQTRGALGSSHRQLCLLVGLPSPSYLFPFLLPPDPQQSCPLTPGHCSSMIQVCGHHGLMVAIRRAMPRQDRVLLHVPHPGPGHSSEAWEEALTTACGAHLGVGVWEVELIQTVLPRVQQAPNSQCPISTGDRTRAWLSVTGLTDSSKAQ
jgi:hypothetical protein